MQCTKCEYSEKNLSNETIIYLSLTRETGCFNWNVETFVPCAASANPDAQQVLWSCKNAMHKDQI